MLRHKVPVGQLEGKVPMAGDCLRLDYVPFGRFDPALSPDLLWQAGRVCCRQCPPLPADMMLSSVQAEFFIHENMSCRARS